MNHGPDTAVEHRAGYSTVIPYIRITLPPECIKGIVVGPCPDPDLAHKGVLSLVRAANKRLWVDGLPVPDLTALWHYMSEVPLRT